MNENSIIRIIASLAMMATLNETLLFWTYSLAIRKKEVFCLKIQHIIRTHTCMHTQTHTTHKHSHSRTCRRNTERNTSECKLWSLLGDEWIRSDVILFLRYFPI